MCERFPTVFVAERWMPHRPLKVGIDKDILTLGVLSAKKDVRAAMRAYVGRPMYQHALTAGGPR